jgi:2,3-bisphosphoglycerate-independent phosphoglycerate mutase
MGGLKNLTKRTVTWNYDRYETRRIVDQRKGRIRRSNALQLIVDITNQIEEYQTKVEAYYNAYTDMVEMNIVYADAISNLHKGVYQVTVISTVIVANKTIYY